ncbi:unnamed protein product [Absidia cylindrospora]
MRLSLLATSILSTALLIQGQPVTPSSSNSTSTTASPSPSSTSSPPPNNCKVVAKTDLDGRDLPKADATRVPDIYKAGDCIDVKCQLKGETMYDTPVWDLDTKGNYLPDYYVKTGHDGFSDAFPRCPDSGQYETGSGKDIVAKAQTQDGIQYSWGGGNETGPSNGICCSPSGYDDRNVTGYDCSGLTKFALYQIKKINLIHYTCNQFNDTRGTQYPFDQAQPGDLIFYGTDEQKCNSHVAIYAGDQQMVEARQHEDPVGTHPVRDGHAPYVVRF